MNRAFSFLFLFWIVSSIHSVAHANINFGSFDRESEVSFVSGTASDQHVELLKHSPTSTLLDLIAPRYQFSFYQFQGNTLSDLIQVSEGNSYHFYISGLSPPSRFLI